MKWQFVRFYIGFVIILLIAGFIIFFSVQRDFERTMDERFERFMAPWVDRIREELVEAPEDREVRSRMIEEIDYRPRFQPRHDKQRRGPPLTKLVARDELSLSDEAKQRLDNGEVVAVREDGKRFVYAALPGNDVAVIESSSRRSRDREEEATGSILILLAPPLGILTLIGIAVFLLIRPIERRISSLTEATRSFGAGALDTRAQVGRTGTMDELEESFNAMAGRVEELVDGQRELLRAVSHDLRTPLARVFFALDDAQTARSVEEKNQHLLRIDRSLVELNDLVDELTTYLHLDSGAAEPAREWIDILPTIQHAAGLVADLRKEIVLTVSCDNQQVFAEPRYLKRAVVNLVTNAVIHARESVWITCRSEQEAFVLSVDDDGEGIPEEERDKVFEPFFRRERSRNLDLGGSGLGLAIVARIMAWHGGTVLATESQHGGACFTLSFPGEVPRSHLSTAS